MLSVLRGWIWFCAIMTITGWVATLIECLNRAAYGIALLVFVGCAWRLWHASRGTAAFTRSKWRRRFSRPLPILYLTLATLAIAGGLIYQPTNIDGFSYRIPRILHWLGEQRWHWIHSSDVRLNVVAPGFDWLSAPVLLFTREERFITLINAASYLLLPGAVYLALDQLGVKKRVAAKWMWIVPAGFCYCMQAGSIANDMYAAIFTLASVGLAMRVRVSRNPWDFWTSVLALALATNAKQTLLPFGLPWLIAAIATLRVFRPPIGAAIGVFAMALGASAIPISVLNVLHGGYWQGFPPGQDYAPPNAFWGIVGNAFWIAFSNLQPPIIPWAGSWNVLRQRFLESDFGEPFRSFEMFAYLHRAASEQFSGIGCTVLILLVVSGIAGGRAQGVSWNLQRFIRASIWLGFFVFMAKVGINQCPRYLAPWYPFLAASFLLGPRHTEMMRARWWKIFSMAVLSVSILLTILSRQRPLFPAQTLLNLAKSRLSANGSLEKIFNSYAFANSLRTELEPFLQKIPKDQRILGYAVRFGDKEPFLWQPYFARKVIRIRNSDAPEAVRASRLQYIVVSPSALTTVHDRAIVSEPPSRRSNIQSIDEWLRVYEAELVATGEYLLAPEGPREKLYLTRLKR